MKKMLQIASACDWEGVFFSYDDGKPFREPVLFSALVSETPYEDDDNHGCPGRGVRGVKPSGIDPDTPEGRYI